MSISGLIHRARVVGERQGVSRNGQGEYESEPVWGPWIAARVMERGGVAAKARRFATSTAAVAERGYEVLLDTVDVNGNAVEVPAAGAVLETDCDVLGSPTIALSGIPEILNNGDELIAILCYGDIPKDSA